MTPEDAEEYTQSLGQIVAGSWRQIAWAQRQGIPEALGLTTEEWVNDRLGGYVRLSITERKEAVKELTASLEEGGEGLSTREAAEVLGVNHNTVARDRRAVSNDTAQELPSPSEELLHVSNDTAHAGRNDGRPCGEFSTGSGWEGDDRESVSASVASVPYLPPTRVSEEERVPFIMLPADPKTAAAKIREAYDDAWVTQLIDALTQGWPPVEHGDAECSSVAYGVQIAPADREVLDVMTSGHWTVEDLVMNLGNRTEKSIATSLSKLTRAGRIERVGTRGRTALYGVA